MLQIKLKVYCTLIHKNPSSVGQHFRDKRSTRVADTCSRHCILAGNKALMRGQDLLPLPHRIGDFSRHPTGSSLPAVG